MTQAHAMNMNDQYSVSLIIPSYQTSAQGKQKVVSSISKFLKDQDYDKSKYEVVFVDDGSPGNTAGLLRKKFANEIDQGRLKVLRQKNNGRSSARNMGIENASGNYLLSADDDDPPLDNRIKDTINYFRANPNKRFMHAKTYWLDGDLNKRHNGRGFIDGLSTHRENLAKYNKLDSDSETQLVNKSGDRWSVGKNIVHTATVAAHKTLYDDIKSQYGYVYDPWVSHSDDRDLWARIAKFARDHNKTEMGFMDKIVGNYVYTEATAKKEQRKIKHREFIDGYIGSKLNNPNQETKVIFADNDLDNPKLFNFLHTEGKRAFRQGERVTFVFRDPNSKQYVVRRLDTDVVSKKKGELFKGKMLKYDSIEELLKEHNLEDADQVQYVNGTHFWKEHKKFFKGKTPYSFVITDDLKDKDLESSGKKISKSGKRRWFIKGADEVILHTNENEGLEDLIDKKLPEYGGVVRQWASTLEDFKKDAPYAKRKEHVISRLNLRKDLDRSLKTRYKHMADVVGEHSHGRPYNMVDLGCNTGVFTNYMAKLGYKVTGVDISAKHLRIAEKHNKSEKVRFIEYQKGDATNLENLNDNSFSVANITELLEHVPDYMKVFDEAMRVVKPNGRIFVSVPKENLVPHPGHINVFTKSKLEGVVRSLGAEIKWHNDPKVPKYLICSFQNPKLAA